MKRIGKKDFLAIAIKTILLTLSYEFVFRGLLQPRLDILAIFFVIVFACEFIGKRIELNEEQR